MCAKVLLTIRSWFGIEAHVCTKVHIRTFVYIEYIHYSSPEPGYTGTAVMSMCVQKYNLDYSSPAEPETGFDKKDIAGVGCSCNRPSI